MAWVAGRSAVALSLTRLGHEVLAIDRSAALVQEWSDQLTHAVEADSTSVEAPRRLGAYELDHAIVAIGEDVEASVLTVLALSEIGVKDIWAKARADRQGGFSSARAPTMSSIRKRRWASASRIW